MNNDYKVIQTNGFNAPLITIQGDDYQRVASASMHMWSSKVAGIANTKDDPYRVERAGFLGEAALAKVLGKPLQFAYVEGGDGGCDIRHNGKEYDVKTSLRDLGECYIMSVSPSGFDYLAHVADIYVAAYIQADDPKQKKAEVVLVGYQSGAFVKMLRDSPTKSVNLCKRLKFSDLNKFPV